MNILLLYGGKSTEHDISILTAEITLNALIDKHKVFPVYVDTDNVWWLLSKRLTPQQTKSQYKKYGVRAYLTCGDNRLKTVGKFNTTKTIATIDVAVPCFHGINGEDGSVSGLLQLCNIPYTTGKAFSNGACMDKIASKTILKGIGARVLSGCILKNLPDGEKAVKKLGFPLVIKPANTGSSIGISLAENQTQLDDALKLAFTFDDKVLAERALTDFYEVNCSAMRIDGRICTGEVERPVPRDKILSFADKYARGQKGDADRIFPYKFDGEQYVKTWTKRIYNAFDCSGVIRVDFLVNNLSDEIFVNEVNAIPGSLSYYLWQPQYTHSEFLELLIKEAIREHNKKSRLTYAFLSGVLNGGSGIKTNK